MTKRILVPIDFGPASGAALDYAGDLARAMGASLYLLHVVDEVAATYLEYPFAALGEVQTSIGESARQQLYDLVSREDLQSSRPHAAILISTSPAHAIVEYARNKRIDLIVMGTHARAPLVRMFLGSVADRVVRTAACPVLTVRGAKRQDAGAERLDVHVPESKAVKSGALTSG